MRSRGMVRSVLIKERGPREGFQIERGPCTAAPGVESAGLWFNEAARLAGRITGRALPGTLPRSGGPGPIRARAA